MTSKRVKVPQANTSSSTTQEAAPAQLVSEVFDCLLEAGRSELAGLLAVLLKASSKSALEAVRDAASLLVMLVCWLRAKSESEKPERWKAQERAASSNRVCATETSCSVLL